MRENKREPLSKEEYEQAYSEYLSDFIDNKIQFSKLRDELYYMPMLKDEHDRYCNTLDALRDNMFFSRITFGKNLGEAIFKAYCEAFDRLLDAGKQQAAERIAYMMRVKDYPPEDIALFTEWQIPKE